MVEDFLGYLRPDGSVGIRNKVVVISSVVCVNSVARRIAEKLSNTVAITHPYGCGQMGQAFSNTFNVLKGLASNANVYGALVIGLGCENLSSNRLAENIRKSQKPVESFEVQEIQGGTRKAIELGLTICKRLEQEASELKRESFDFSNLILGLECGGSDSISGITANPAVGIVSDKLISLGGTSILPEFTEWIGTEHLLSERAINKTVAENLNKPIEKFLERTMERGIDFRGVQPTPGNIAGGLSTIEEKSLGNIEKAGKAPIQGVLNYTEKPKGKGLWMMIEPGFDVDSMTGLAAAGAQVIVMTTGRGTPLGNPVAPVIKICGNPKTCDWMASNIDIDASKIITQNKTIEYLGEELWKYLTGVCSGDKTSSENLRFEEDIGIWTGRVL